MTAVRTEETHSLRRGDHDRTEDHMLRLHIERPCLYLSCRLRLGPGTTISPSVGFRADNQVTVWFFCTCVRRNCHHESAVLCLHTHTRADTRTGAGAAPERFLERVCDRRQPSCRCVALRARVAVLCVRLAVGHDCTPFLCAAVGANGFCDHRPKDLLFR